MKSCLIYASFGIVGGPRCGVRWFMTQTGKSNPACPYCRLYDVQFLVILVNLQRSFVDTFFSRPVYFLIFRRVASGPVTLSNSFLLSYISFHCFAIPRHLFVCFDVLLHLLTSANPIGSLCVCFSVTLRAS